MDASSSASGFRPQPTWGRYRCRFLCARGDRRRARRGVCRRRGPRSGPHAPIAVTARDCARTAGNTGRAAAHLAESVRRDDEAAYEERTAAPPGKATSRRRDELPEVGRA